MIKRELYLQKLRPFIDKPFIKVLTGIRRCGKSSVLMLMRDEFLARGESVLHLNFESMEYADIDNAEKLNSYIAERAKNLGRKIYLFLDEIQIVNGWEKVINSLLLDERFDIYITGSNSKLLSSELSTFIAGRYVETKINTLSFSEYKLFKSSRGLTGDIREYVRLGGFPAIHLSEYGADTAYGIISDICASALLRDTVQRHKIRDTELLERVVGFVFENIGNTFSAKNVSDYFKSQNRKIDINTVYNYLSALESSFIVKPVRRYDIKGKEVLKTQEKYYLADHSLLYSRFGYKDRYIAGVLENIVMNELCRRGYSVHVGKLNGNEVDFVAEANGEKIYIQVAYLMESSETVEREFKPLLLIKDSYPKYVVSMDEFWRDNIDGVRHVNLTEFLEHENI